MLKELGFTDARSNLTAVIDDVQKWIPAMIKARKRSESGTILMNNDMVKELLLGSYKFEIEATHEETGEVSLWDNVTDFGAFGDTFEEALHELALVLSGYAEGYYEQSTIFLNDPNTRKQFPYILRVLMCESNDELKDILRKNICQDFET